jgi:hypothetical protein
LGHFGTQQTVSYCNNGKNSIPCPQCPNADVLFRIPLHVKPFRLIINCKDKILTFRIQPAVNDGLRVIAEKERRSLANMIEVIIRHYCDQAGVRIVETDIGTVPGRPVEPKMTTRKKP